MALGLAHRLTNAGEAAGVTIWRDWCWIGESFEPRPRIDA